MSPLNLGPRFPTPLRPCAQCPSRSPSRSCPSTTSGERRRRLCAALSLKCSARPPRACSSPLRPADAKPLTPSPPSLPLPVTATASRAPCGSCAARTARGSPASSRRRPRLATSSRQPFWRTPPLQRRPDAQARASAWCAAAQRRPGPVRRCWLEALQAAARPAHNTLFFPRIIRHRWVSSTPANSVFILFSLRSLRLIDTRHQHH